MTEYVGIDGCPAGWIAVFINEYGMLNVEVEKNLKDFPFDRQYPNDIILIDMPLGLENRPDGALRKAMNGNKSSVFSLSEKLPSTEEEYDSVKDTITMSEQTKAIMHKIYEAKRFAGKDPAIFKFWESHPEFCFELLNNRKQLFPKKTGAGQAERLLILKEYLGVAGIEKLLQEASKQEKDAFFKFDDLLDAACLAVMAKIIGTKENCSVITDKGKQMTVPDRYPFIAYAKNFGHY